MKKRDVYKYNVKKGNRVLRTGITNDLRRRMNEYRQDSGGKLTIEQVGRRTTEEAAYKWMAKQPR